MDEAFLARARAIGVRILAALRSLQAGFPQIQDVRGLGAMLAMELSSGAPEIVEAARERGLLLLWPASATSFESSFRSSSATPSSKKASRF